MIAYHPFFHHSSPSPSTSTSSFTACRRLAFNMPSLYSRHPRYILLAAFLLLSTFLLLASQRVPPGAGRYYDELSVGYGDDEDTLKSRLASSETIYQRMLTARAGLVKKFGPSPEQVAMCVLSFTSFSSLLELGRLGGVEPCELLLWIFRARARCGCHFCLG